MLCKGIVDKVIDPYSARVRIPIYHKIAGSPFATPSENLPIASICVMPGVEMALKEGDIVFLEFELGHRDNPVIMGCLSRNQAKSSSNISTQSLKVAVNCELPLDIKYPDTTQIKTDNNQDIIDNIVINELDVEFLTD